MIPAAAKPLTAALIALALGLLAIARPDTLRAQDAAPELDATLNEAQVRALMERLSDEQVRALLVAEF
ncbi:MAG: hypothetical protein AAFU61_03560, partial [Pseudomonadota bacterium]